MISCILLAAGFSSRFGSPKALAELPGERVIERLQNELLKTQVEEIVAKKIAELGATAKAQTGQVMKAVMAQYGSQVDGKMVQQIVAEKLT